MKKSVAAFLLSAVCLLNVFAVSACGEKEEDNPVEEKLTYADLYRTEQKKSEPLMGKALYKASYGYTLSEEQGYNHFRYQYCTDGTFSDMSFKDGSWTGGGASMENGTMRAARDTDAVRTFSVPVSGQAHVYGNPGLLSGERAKVSIVQGDSLVAEYEITDKIGVYHSHTLELKEGETLRFIVSGDAEVYWNPTVDYTLAEEVSLHHTVDGYYGDVHPFYDEKSGKLYMYYLSTGLQTQNKVEQFASLLSVSGNFIRYDDVQLKMDEANPPEQELYYALGVYVDKDGRYRSSYGKGNYAGGSVSDDLIVWKNAAEPYVDEADGLLKYTWRAYFDEGVYSGRDPDICYDAESGKYYCVVMNYYSSAEAQGEKGLALYTAGEDGRFSTQAVRLVDLTGRGDPECPQLKKIGDRWYLFYSVYGTGTAGNVGYLTYRVGDVGVSPDKVDWSSKAEHALEGGDLHAAQLCKVGDMWYMYGWLNYTPHANVWGGYLNLAREVYQKPDGLLGTRCDEYLSDLLNMGHVASFGKENVEVSGMNVSENSFIVSSDTGKAALGETYGRSWLSADIELPASADYAGFTLSEGGTTYYVRLERTDGELYLSIDSGSVGCSIKLEDASETSFRLEVVADGPFIEAYVNDEYSLSCNTRLTGNYTLGIAGGGAGAKISAAEVCKLADYNNIFD